MRPKITRHTVPRGFGKPALSVVLGVAACLVAGLAIRRTLSQKRAPSPAAVSAGSKVDPPKTQEGTGTHQLFVDATAEAGIDSVHVLGEQRALQLPEQMGSGGAFFDYDNDGDIDLYLVQSGLLGVDDAKNRNRLYRNDGSGNFTEVGSGSGADIPGYGMGCAAADYDNDGDVDLYVTRLGSSVLLRNEGQGRFVNVTREAGVGATGFATSAAFFDYDRDGLLDLYVARYVAWAPHLERTCYAPSGARDYCGPLTYNAPTTDRLYHNVGSGRFEDVSARAGIESAEGNGLGVVSTDFNGDGRLDLYVANDQTPAFLWINQGDGTFLEQAALAGAAYSADAMAIAGMGIAAEDLDDDADYDLVVTNIRNQPHLALRNDGGQFTDVTQAWGFGGWSVPYTGFGIALFDQDHDGRLDGIVANGAVNMWGEPFKPGDPYAEPNQFLRRDAKGRFYDATAQAGAAVRIADVSRGTILGDYDDDGDLDLVITNNGGPAQLLRNENRSGLAWTLLDLVPKGGGRNALNARIELVAAGRTFRREVRPHAGYLTSNDPRVHVGLGKAEVIDRLTILWRDGGRERWGNLPVNQCLLIRQGSKPRPCLPRDLTAGTGPRP